MEEIRVDQFDKQLRNSFFDSFRNQKNCDVAFITEGRIIRAHRCVVSLFSGNLRAIFDQSFKPAPVNVAFINYRYAHVEAILRFMYTGVIRVDHKEMDAVYKCAQDLKINDLSNRLEALINAASHLVNGDDDGDKKVNIKRKADEAKDGDVAKKLKNGDEEKCSKIDDDEVTFIDKKEANKSAPIIYPSSSETSSKSNSTSTTKSTPTAVKQNSSLNTTTRPAVPSSKQSSDSSKQVSTSSSKVVNNVDKNSTSSSSSTTTTASKKEDKKEIIKSIASTPKSGVQTNAGKKPDTPGGAANIKKASEDLSSKTSDNPSKGQKTNVTAASKESIVDPSEKSPVVKEQAPQKTTCKDCGKVYADNIVHKKLSQYPQQASGLCPFAEDCKKIIKFRRALIDHLIKFHKLDVCEEK